MNNKITFTQVVASLQATGQAFEVLQLQNGVCLVITRRGGRVFGPFLSEESASLYWLNAAFADAASLQPFLDADDWNQGGERFWIAPEIQYNVTDRTDFAGTLHVPPQMDPGDYQISTSGNTITLDLALTLPAYNLATGEKTLKLARTIQAVPDPLREVNGYDALLNGVTYAGYSQTATLSEGQADAIMSETWNLIQLNPGGTLIIPASPHVQATGYVEPLPADAYAVADGALRIPLDGHTQFKVGYKAAQVGSRMGYLNTLDEERAYLLMRHYPNNPSSIYVEEAPDKPGQRGESIHVYNDDGNFGGFGEMECHGQTIGGEAGISRSTDTFTLWLYAGAPHRIKLIGEHLLGVPL
jgi:hypothetical protein